MEYLFSLLEVEEIGNLCKFLAHANWYISYNVVMKEMDREDGVGLLGRVRAMWSLLPGKSSTANMYKG